MGATWSGPESGSDEDFDDFQSENDFIPDSTDSSNANNSLEENDEEPDRSTDTNFDPVIYAKKPLEQNRLMENEKLREIARLLVGFTGNPINVSAANFCVEDTLSPNDIQISVKGIGMLKFPITVGTINKLKSKSTKAKYGVGEKTVLNENFRNTHMIKASDLNVKINENSLTTILQRMQVSLGIAEDKKLNASLHNLLIYEEGHFFDKHRDSEKIPNMVATLVIVLPSPHIGGSLVVEHGRKKYEISTENLNEINAKCICFYSDCWHSVEKVKKGNRIVVIYNIALEGDNIDLKPVNHDLKTAVHQYFLEGDTKKLVFLLNHSYSENSLRWHLLKGEDYKVALSFLAVAKSLNLTVNLALVDIRQHWNCGNDNHHTRRGMELYETEHFLKYWVGANNTILTYEPFRADNGEICFTKETFHKNFKPEGIDRDGPTGNEGCTSSYSYQRAALVMWKAKNSPRIMLELNSAQVIQQLSELIKSPGNEEEVKRIVNLAGKDLFTRFAYSKTFNTCRNFEISDILGISRRSTPSVLDTRESFNDSLDIALYVRDENAALIALSGYNGWRLNNNNIPYILAIQKQYGVELLTRVLQPWLDLCDMHKLMPFVADYLKAGGAMEAMQFVVKHIVKKETEEPKSYYYYSNEDIINVFKACNEVGDVTSQELFAKFITTINCRSKSELVDSYLILKGLNSKGFKPFLLILIESIKTDIKNIQSQGLWYSDDYHRNCSCDKCKTIFDFMKSNKQTLALESNSISHLQSQFYSRPVTVSKVGSGKTAIFTIKKDQSVYQKNAVKLKELSELLSKLGKAASKREVVVKENVPAKKKK